MPIEWRELPSIVQADAYPLAAVLERLRQSRTDPWAEMFQVRQSLTKSCWQRLTSLAVG
jgi:DNA primase